MTYICISDIIKAVRERNSLKLENGDIKMNWMTEERLELDRAEAIENEKLSHLVSDDHEEKEEIVKH